MTGQALNNIEVRPGDGNAVERVEEWFREYNFSHDPAVRERIILAYLGMADRLASRFRTSANVSSEDLTQTARLALIRAVDRYDARRPSPFVVYAVVCITGELKHFLREWSWLLHVTRSEKEHAIGAIHSRDDLTVALGRVPTAAEIAEDLGMDQAAVIGGLNAMSAWQIISLDAPVEPNATVSVGDLVADVSSDTEIEDLLILPDLLATLPEQERRAVVLRFFRDLRQSDIGAVLGCSQMQVSRLLRRAFRRMRQRLDPAL